MSENWHQYPAPRLGEACNLAYGKNLPTKNLIESGFPVFGANGTIGYFSQYLYEKPMVLVSCRGEYSGTIRITDPCSFVTNNSIVCEIKDGYSLATRYLYWFLQSIPRASIVSGSAQPQVIVSDLAKPILKIPPIEEQRSIAAILDTMDEAIRRTEALIAKLQKVKAGLLHDLLTRGLDEHGQLRDPLRHPEQFKDSELGRIPKEWEVKKLGEICRPKQWHTIAASQFTTVGYPVYGANGLIGFHHTYNHEHPTVAITCRGATCGTVHLTPNRCYITGNAMALDDLPEDLMASQFLAEFLRFRGLDDAVTGSAQPQIIRSSLIGIAIPIPDRREQQDSLLAVSSITDSVEKNNQALNKLKLKKSALMQDLLTGKVRIAEKTIKRFSHEHNKNLKNEPVEC